ncbi:MAG TPA: ABC transporter substrate-binding protein [Candidatus Binatia bacterium]|nr:ABC transporter substrate-binding protein [Candidatus Binatia bacterium]
MAWLFMAEAALAASPVGPRDAVEAAVARFMSIIQNDGQNEADGAVGGERSEQIRRIVREMFDFDEISRRALSRHWQALPPEDQAEFVTLFRDLLERAYLTQVEAVAGSQKIAFLGESIENGSATVRSKLVTRNGGEIPLDYRLHLRDGSWRIYDVAVQGVSFITSYRTQFDRVIRAESYSSLRERLQKKAMETTAAQR